MKTYDDDFDAENDFITDRDLGDEDDYVPDYWREYDDDDPFADDDDDVEWDEDDE